jgi:DNA-binding winged helix-turn-helix (wHTH) protein/TolB-like protein
MKSAGPRYRFGAFVLIPSEHALLRADQPLHLARLDFELLVALVERAGQLVRKEELLQRLWPDTIVEEGNLNKHVSTLRKALGDAGGGNAIIQTVPGVGFRFAAPVAPVQTPVPADRRRKVRVGALAAVVLVCTGVVLGVVLTRNRSRDIAESPRWTALAILPFTAIGGDAPEHLGLGLADGIITRLSSQTLLPVRPTSAVHRFQTARRPSPADLGRALNVDVILEGHIQRAGDAVRVTVQLTDVGSASPVWADTFDEQATEVFRLEDAIAERVSSALRLRLAAAEQQRLRRRYTTNAAAYAAYIAGREELMRYTPAGTRNALAAFERALNLDAGYTLARAGVAMASADMYLRFAPASELQHWGERAEREALAAIAEDPDLPEAHVARAAVSRKREFDWDATVASSRRALVLNPNLDQPRYYIATALYHQGLMAESLAEMERGRRTAGSDQIEPLRIAGLVALFSADFTQARQRLEDVARQSNRAIADTYLALAYYYSGERARARAMLEALTKEASASTAARSRVALAAVLGASGERHAARLLVDAVLADTYRDHHVEYGLGAALAQLGQSGAAVEWLRKSADHGFPCAIWYERDPLLQPVRSKPEFSTLLADLRARRNATAGRFAAP